MDLTAAAAGHAVSIEERVRLPAVIQPQSHRSHEAVRSRLQDVLRDFTTRRAVSRRRRRRAECGVVVVTDVRDEISFLLARAARRQGKVR